MSTEPIRSHKDLEVLSKSLLYSHENFSIVESFPKEEKYALTDQIRRYSRSICANLAETWLKPRYQAAFIAKLNDYD
ncbi:MAG UNVERIFIED_CONTAM: four helix bundle protein [Microcystis novacekii LVE1205-3]|jgi:four helix bundle protein